MESHAEITNKEGIPSSPEGTVTDAPRKPRKPRARSEIVTSSTNESNRKEIETKPKKEKKEKKEKKVKKDKLDTESKKSKKEKKDKKSKKETSESNTTTDNEADSFSAIVLPPSYQWPSRKIQSLPYNQTGIKERPSLRNLDPMFLASPKLESKEWVESLLVNKAVPSAAPSPDAKKSDFSESTLQRAATAKAYFEDKYKKIATTLNTGNVYNPIEEKRRQIANQRVARTVNRYSADDARIRKARDEAIKLKEEDDKMEKLRMEEEAERKFQEEQREKQLKIMQEESEVIPESGTSPDGPSGKTKFLSIFETNPIDRLGQKLSSLEASRLGQKLSAIDGSKIHQKLKGMKKQVFNKNSNKKRENETMASTPPSPHDAINMNVVDALLQDLEGNDTSLITSEERDLLDALANTTSRPHSGSISQSSKIQVSTPAVVMQDVQSASAENIRAGLVVEAKVPTVQSLPNVTKITEDMDDPEIDKEIDRIEGKIAERERLLQEIHNKFPHFEEIHSFAEEMSVNLADAKKELSETVASVRKMDNDLITNKNKIDISLSTIQRCSDKILKLEEGIQDCQRMKGNIMFAYISSILSVYFLGAFSILAKIAYYPYHEVSKRLATQHTTKPKDSSVDSISADSAPTSPEASVTLQKKKGLLNRKDNWEALQTKMLDVQRLREEEKKKQNL